MLAFGTRLALWQVGDSGVRKPDLLAERDTIREEYRAVWLARSRPGGLDDSAARLDRIPALDTDA
jgi:hypothetical protein